MTLCIAEEKQRLVALPAHAFDCGQVALRVCTLDGFLEFETNRYSVPYEYVGDILSLKATDAQIMIYSPYLELIATHQRHANGCGQICEETAHRQSKSVRYGLEPIRETFERLGDHAPAFLAGLQNKHPHHCGFHARRILLLKECYNADDIDRACARANRYHAYDADAIKRILAAIATPRTLESVRNEKARRELQKKLPPIKQRDLAEYNLLFGKDPIDENCRSDHGKNTQPSANTENETHGEGT